MKRPMAEDLKPRILDLFAGAGGFSLGFHMAGFTTGVAIDHNSIAVEALEANFSHLGTTVLLKDLANFRPSELGRFLKSNQCDASFDVIIGGPPCQGWSKVGRAKLRSLKTHFDESTEHSDPRNALYKSFLDYVGHFQPKIAVMENVAGMLSHAGRNMAEVICADMEAQGYVVTWSLLNATNYGVPQSRERLFFVGVRKDLGVEFKFPEWKTASGRRRYPEVTVRDAIGDLPRIQNGAREWVRDYAPVRPLSSFARLMRAGADSKTVFDHVCRLQNKQDLEAFRFLRQGGKYFELPARLKRYRDDIFDDKYRKLYWNRPSWCVTAHLSRDCYSHIHPGQARTITVREAARLQSFPDSFYLAGSMGDKFQLIGNAVPPLLAEKVALAIRDQIFKEPSSFVSKNLRPRKSTTAGQIQRGI